MNNQKDKNIKKHVLIITMFFILVGLNSCSSDCNNLKLPKWELPQPIDTLLLGSWELIEEDYVLSSDIKRIITFYENNKYINKTISKDQVWASEHHWYVNDDTLVMPDFFDNGTGRFVDYTYNYSVDKKLLCVKLIRYPYICKGEFPNMLIVPLGIVQGTFKKLEDE